jgi:hypothetical protein
MKIYKSSTQKLEASNEFETYFFAGTQPKTCATREERVGNFARDN